MMKHLIQLLPSHHRHDAIGAEASVIQEILENAGWRVDTFAEIIEPELEGKTRHINELADTEAKGAVALYHFAVASPITYRFIDLPCSKAIKYHSVTPPHFLEPYGKDVAAISHFGIKEINLLKDHTDLAFADSEFNQRELDLIGFPATRRVPYLFDPSRYSDKPDAEMLGGLEGRQVILFVGRIFPNKAPDDIIRVAAAWHKSESTPPPLFVLAGKPDAIPAYTEEIKTLASRLGLDEDRLLFTGEISRRELVAAYKSAALFLSLSRHEGFCVPILESWLFDVPVLALAESAIPETVGEAGLLLNTAEPANVAGVAQHLLSNHSLRSDLVRLGRKRLQHFDVNKWGFVLRRYLEEMCK